VEGLQAYYGASHVLHDVSFSMKEGEVLLLLGRNGAGKTTLMKSLMGLVKTRGSVKFRGKETVGLQPHLIARMGVGLVPEDRRMFAQLSVLQNLELGRKKGTGGRADWQLDRIFDIFPALRDLQARKAGNLSGGQQQMVAVARTLLGNPDVVLLDEPAEGLAPVIVQKLAEMVTTLRAKGYTIVMVEQNFRFAAPLADRHYVIEHGAIAEMITKDELSGSMERLNRYLGV
jgi:branched-chain amino acid transport system ATP-binding protein